jgi:acetyl-CoA carboxylase biotin carboxyl carrier protein
MDKLEIRELMRFFDKSDITKLKIKNGEFSIELQKGLDTVTVAAPVVPTAATQAPVFEVSAATSAPVAKKSTDAINSPMVGTFYSSPAPGTPAFINVGDTIKKGQAIGIIEAMKIMNEIEAEFDCKVIELLVQDGQPVEYDMPLFAVEKI